MKNITGSDVIVVGFNARPLAAGIKDAGFHPHVLDFFGDIDIRHVVTRGWYYMDVDKRVPRHDGNGFRGWVMDTLPAVVKAISKYPRGAPDGKPLLVIGSGFDDDIAAWNAFWEHGTVLGNRPEAIMAARDVEYLRTIVEAVSRESGCDARLPKTERFQITNASVITRVTKTIVSRFDLPFVIKVRFTAGGAGVTLVTNHDEITPVLEERFDARGNPDVPLDFCVQEYVRPARGQGMIDASALMLGGDVICTTRQVVGDPRFHAPSRFTYCGNVIPLNVPEPVRRAIETVGRTLHERIGLQGLWGFDFAVYGESITIFEVNPRIPGSMEPASLATGVNLMERHVASFLNKPSGEHESNRPLPRPRATSWGCKYILFASRPVVMPSLEPLLPSLRGTVHDVSPPGTDIPAGAPVLTYLLVQPGIGAFIQEAHVTAAMDEVQSIYSLVSGSC